MGVVFFFHGVVPGTVYLTASLVLRPGHQFQNRMQVEVGLRSEVKNLDIRSQGLDGICFAHRKTMGLIYQIKVEKAKQFILKIGEGKMGDLRDISPVSLRYLKSWLARQLSSSYVSLLQG